MWSLRSSAPGNPGKVFAVTAEKAPNLVIRSDQKEESISQSLEEIQGERALGRPRGRRDSLLVESAREMSDSPVAWGLQLPEDIVSTILNYISNIKWCKTEIKQFMSYTGTTLLWGNARSKHSNMIMLHSNYPQSRTVELD